MGVSRSIALTSCGAGLVGTSAALSVLSRDFVRPYDPLQMPVVELVALLFGAGLLYLLSVRLWAARRTPGRRAVLLLFAVGAAMRVAMAASIPALEDDFYRYLWDGAVTVHGLDPYAYSPAEALEDAAPHELAALARAAPAGIVERINHPHLRTVYPPLVQLVFAAAHPLSPWSIAPLRALYLVFDLLTLGVLWITLRRLSLPPWLLAVYWWNPLLVKEVYNSLHFDVVALPFALGALCLASGGAPLRTAASLAAGAGVKLWPLLLAPVAAARLWAAKGRRAAAVVFALGVAVGVAVLALPLWLAGVPAGETGFARYVASWENNDLFFKGLVRAAGWALPLAGIPAWRSQPAARLFVATLVAAAALYAALRARRSAQQASSGALLVVAALFLLGPTAFPWYYVWMIPFLALAPRWSLLSLTPLLALYYLGYYFEPRGYDHVKERYVVLVEFLPVWTLLAIELVRRRARPYAATTLAAGGGGEGAPT